MCILEWSIDKIFTITTDNAISNYSTIDHLKIVEVGKVDCIADYDFIHIRYIVHILNLVVQESLKEVDDSITKI